jgi:hypothetical protein
MPVFARRCNRASALCDAAPQKLMLKAYLKGKTNPLHFY